MQITKAQATMTSLELVDTINEVRAAEGKKPLRHDNFMVKIEKHPAIDSPKYLGQYDAIMVARFRAASRNPRATQ